MYLYCVLYGVLHRLHMCVCMCVTYPFYIILFKDFIILIINYFFYYCTHFLFIFKPMYSF